ncbi:MAG: thymidine phosphorylase [Oscillospiraceae bacterium]|nr:thymidine phosphorylase [Oscillospiraceae bacterium]
MLMQEITTKKLAGEALTPEEIEFAVGGFTEGSVPDYQMSALLAAICAKGMTAEETYVLTECMKSSGQVLDLSFIRGVKLDKHSTGGVGDKTSLVLVPLIAASRGKVVKMSGRSLGYTGGTIDKLESIPGFRTDLTREEMIAVADKVGCVISGQTAEIAPADKKMYALRDVTGTVSSIPLIASSIMSKKLASGADIILLDVKVGSGAFMKTREQALELAQTMVDIGKRAGKKVAAILTSMDVPLGNAVGNSLEVIEAVETLSGRGPGDFADICVMLAAYMVAMKDGREPGKCIYEIMDRLYDGTAKAKLRAMVEAQGGDPTYIDDTSKFPKAKYRVPVKAPQDGYLGQIDTHLVGLAAQAAGAGRKTKDEPIDHSAGIVLENDGEKRFKKGDVIATVHAATPEKAKEAEDILLSALSFSPNEYERMPLLMDALFEQDETRGPEIKFTCK